jgi:hypothetical protein
MLFEITFILCEPKYPHILLRKFLCLSFLLVTDIFNLMHVPVLLYNINRVKFRIINIFKKILLLKRQYCKIFELWFSFGKEHLGSLIKGTVQ